MGVEWGGSNERKRRGAKALGWDQQKGWGPGLGVNSLPGAPGANDAAIFGRKPLQTQQFDTDDPYEAGLQNQMDNPTTEDDYSIAEHMEQQRQESLSAMDRPAQQERIRRHVEIYGSDPT